jgi:hypothetical protein
MPNCGAASVVADFHGANARGAFSAGAGGAFSPGRDGLRFGDAAARSAKLAGPAARPGFYVLTFHGYSSTNSSPGGRGLGSFVALGMGDPAHFVRVMRGNVHQGGYFEANAFEGSLQIWYDQAGAEAGRLGLQWDGKQIAYYYSASTTGGGWSKVGPTVAPGWSGTPRLFISANHGGSGITRFTVDAVTVAPCTSGQ